MTPLSKDQTVQINGATGRILASPDFVAAERQAQLLRFVVAEAVAGRADGLKESVIAIEVFGRDGFDGRSDSIVRVEARKLRENLSRYYEREGHAEPVLISVPKGGYRPVFEFREAEPAPQAGPKRRKIWIGVVAAVGVAAVIALVAAALWGSQTGAGRRSSGVSPGNPGTIAVLPFANLDANKDNEYFADGLTDQLIDELGRLEGVRVVARASAFQFKGKNGDIREVGRHLGASFVLEGSVARLGNRVRATAELIQVRDGLQIWSHRYEAESASEFELQSSITRDILATLRTRRGGTDEVALASRYPASGEAYDRYLKGLFAYDLDSQEGLEQSLQEYEEALRLDPGYAPAMSAKAGAYVALGIFGMWKPDAAMSAARDAARRALQRDPKLGEAYAVLGYVSAVYDWNWQAAEEAFRRSVELNPNCAHCHAWYAIYDLAPQGREKEAFDQIAKCVELDPLTLRFRAFRIMVPVLAGDNQRAIEEGQRLMGEIADDYIGHLYLSSALRQSGRTADAVGEAKRGAELSHQAPLALRFLAEAYGADGQTDRVRAIAGDVEERAKTAYVSPVLRASVAVSLGDRAGAGRWLAQAVAEHDPALIFLRPSAVFQRLRGTVAFDDVWRRIGLPG